MNNFWPTLFHICALYLEHKLEMGTVCQNEWKILIKFHKLSL